MLITLLTHEDCAQAAKLHQVAFYKGWTKKDFEDFLEDRNVSGLKTKESENLYGYILWREIKDEAEILTLVISPPYQRRGMGNHLLNALCERLKEKSIAKLFLEVAEDNKIAQDFYIKNGFIFLGTRSNYYKRPKNQCVDALNFYKVIEDRGMVN
jgi:ribosomal-protein-alanine N-acetyltransferase